MHFYRPLGPVAALTFDLDDTLYDNAPVIQRTEQATLLFIQRYHPRLSGIQREDMLRVRQALREDEPEIYHDVTEWRHRALERLMREAGLSVEEAQRGAAEAMADFANWRSRVDVPQETHDTLAALGKKWPLAAVTNGNADPARFGLDGYFDFILRAGPHGRAKPFCDMYHTAAQRLGLPAGQILHVGDDLNTDVAGAICSGMQACWIMSREQNLMQARKARLLPHLAISRLASLAALI
ncbi:5-amino-6-(5-phospho-D-ribitylamino)uracil phosphatase YigB [Erwinia sp. HR93]|uniref:5-amino-6-(5-phospho-D-ribitylamino)uracil phosphatase YigB n=1 Tax=Erwinia sp. HR93 TaxID=3094840 RepID=UPI002ADEDB85|nr:5-amino-6-(5-phospho-D-ribitylamino)uracil phosphatase YigB [Erwinia sp. HR93]MEA1062635.1 5-amino-6-(5-phospho-D-ribitylamino)uracil phosphatase YigB [Erwinia sp. HR93]